MTRPLIASLSLTALALLALGCAPKARLQVWRPAEEDVKAVERLVILDLDGEEQSGKIARAALEGQFAENKHYTLVDPSVLAQVHPLRAADGSIDVAAALDAARTVGVDAILTGQVVSYKVLDDEEHDTHLSIGGGGGSNKQSGMSFSALGLGIDSNETITREASVSLAIKLLDVQSQKVVAVRQASHHVNARQVNGQGELPSRERVLTELLHECSRDVVRLLAPHYRSTEVTLARQFYGNGFRDLRRGNKLAVKGDWGGAQAEWEKALAANRKNHAAVFNLGLAAEARQDLPGALRLVDQATKEYPATLYHDARKRLQTEQDQYLAAARQVDAKRLAPSLARGGQSSPSPPPNALPASFEGSIPSSSDQTTRLPTSE